MFCIYSAPRREGSDENIKSVHLFILGKGGALNPVYVLCDVEEEGEARTIASLVGPNTVEMTPHSRHTWSLWLSRARVENRLSDSWGPSVNPEAMFLERAYQDHLQHSLNDGIGESESRT